MRETPHLVIVVPGDRVDEARARFEPVAAAASAPLDVVAGGDTRQESVARGLALLAARDRHGARARRGPRRSPRRSCSTRSLAAVRARGHGVIPALDVVDTIKRVDDRRPRARDRRPLASSRPCRRRRGSRAPRSCTPTRRPSASTPMTRRSSAAAGMAVDAVPGDARSFKVTLPATCVAPRRRWPSASVRGCPGVAAAAASPLRRRRVRARALPRIGTGVDVHAFADDPTPRSGSPACTGRTSAASRATATATPSSHASATPCSRPRDSATSARVFGTGDPAVRGRARRGVPHARRSRRVREAGFAVGNVTVQVIGNRPKLAPRRARGRGAALRASWARRSASPRRRPTGSGSPAAARGSRRSPPRCSSPPDPAAGPRRDRVTPRGAPVGLAGDRAPLRLEGPGAA